MFHTIMFRRECKYNYSIKRIAAGARQAWPSTSLSALSMASAV
jgi:hypothetical protein